MIGLKRGIVELEAHKEEWIQNAENTIAELKQLLGTTALDIQHVGSTAILSVHAKPILDIAVGVRRPDDILAYVERLRQRDIIFRGEDITGQMLFVKGDFENDTRTHHIHVVKWNGTEWNQYINFRDYLNADTEKAMMYDSFKRKLADRFPNDRNSYTKGKQEIIDSLLEEANIWKKRNAPVC